MPHLDPSVAVKLFMYRKKALALVWDMLGHSKKRYMQYRNGNTIFEFMGDMKGLAVQSGSLRNHVAAATRGPIALHNSPKV